MGQLFTARAKHRHVTTSVPVYTGGSDDQSGGRNAPLHTGCADVPVTNDTVYRVRDDARDVVRFTDGSIIIYQLRDTVNQLRDDTALRFWGIINQLRDSTALRF